MDALDLIIENEGASAYVLYASSQDAKMRYLSGFWIGDPVVYLRRPGERGIIIVPQMEYDRAVRESSCAVMTLAQAGFFDILEEEKDRTKVYARMIAGQTGGEIIVPGSFPVALARELDALCSVKIDPGTVEEMRAVKTGNELACIQECQRAAEGAMDVAQSMIRDAKIRDGELVLNGEPLTSGMIRQEMHVYLLRRGFRATDTIVSCGAETAMPHRLGEGVLLEGEPIVIDVFPRDERTGYYADMTRTVVRGEPDPEIEEMYNAVKGAQETAENMIRPGISGRDVHLAAAGYLDDCGFKTDTKGFIHSLGHGVGLEIHENPALSPAGTKNLVAGNVVTVEPGLYYPGTGGVRLEDIGAVTQEGFTCFTKYPKELRL